MEREYSAAKLLIDRRLRDDYPNNRNALGDPGFIQRLLSMRNLPPLSCLQAFEAAARHLSFTEASKELNCTQAAVSQRVRSLETYLSRQLFLRKSNGLELSEAGEAYLPGVAEALDVAAAATEGLRARKIPRAVTISAPVSLLMIWLTPKLDRFLAQNPNVEIRLNSAIWTDPNADLADVRIEVRDAVEVDPGIPRLPCEQLVLVCAPALAAHFSAAPLQSVLKRFRKIFIQGKYNSWSRWANDDEIALDTGMPAVKLDNAVAALEAAAQGLGITVAYSTYCAPYLASGRLVSPPGAARPTGLCHTLTALPTQPRWHPAHKISEWLAEEFRREGSSSASG